MIMERGGDMGGVVTGGASGLGRAGAVGVAAAGVKVAILDVNEEGGKAVADAIGGLFCRVDITSEDSVVAGYDAARAAHGQERILVHCAQISKGGKTVRYDKASGGYVRYSTEDYAFSAQGILIAS